jgi:hypothetical protein
MQMGISALGNLQLLSLYLNVFTRRFPLFKVQGHTIYSQYFDQEVRELQSSYA